MALTNHIEALRAKHQYFEEQIHDEMLRPRPDFSVITELKKTKLLVKEELMRCIDDLPRTGSA